MRTTFTTWRVALIAALVGLISGRALAQVPDHDDIQNARVLPLTPFVDIFDVGQATGDPSDPGFEGALPTVWYKVRPFTELPLSLDLTLSDSPMAAAVFEDPPSINSVIASGFTIDGLVLEAQATYWVMVFPAFEDDPTKAMPRGKAVLASNLGFAAPAPPNDSLAHPTTIGELPFASIVDMTQATPDPEGLASEDEATVWYTITPAEDLLLRCRLGTSGGDAALGAFVGPPGEDTLYGFGRVAAVGAFDLALAAGATYQLMLVTNSGAPIVVAIDSAPIVPNDLRERATVIDALPFGEVLYVTRATLSVRDVFGVDDEPAPTVWYRFTPTETTLVALDAWTQGPGERRIKVLAAGGSEPLALLENRNDATVRLEAGVTYDFMVALYGEPAPLVFAARRVATAPNDERAHATVITGLPYADWTSELGGEPRPATADPTDPLVHGQLVTRWYRFTPAADVVASLAPSDPQATSAVIFVFDSDFGEANPLAIGPAIDGLAFEAGLTYEIMLAFEEQEESLGLLVAERPEDVSAAGTLSVTGLTADLMYLQGRGIFGCPLACPGDGRFGLSDSDDFDLGAEPTIELPGLRPDVWEIGWARMWSFDANRIFNVRLLFNGQLATIDAGQTTHLDLDVPTPATVRAVLGPIAPPDGDFFYNAIAILDASEGTTSHSGGAVVMVGNFTLSDEYLATMAGIPGGDLTPMQRWEGAPPTLIPIDIGVPADVPITMGFRYIFTLRGIEGDTSALLMGLFESGQGPPPARAHGHGMMRVSAQEDQPLALGRVHAGEVQEVQLALERPAVAALTLHPAAPQAPYFMSMWQGTNASVARTVETTIALRLAYTEQPGGSPYPPDLKAEMPAGTWFGDWMLQELTFDEQGYPQPIGGAEVEVHVEVGDGDVVEQTPGAPFTWNLSPPPGEVCAPTLVFAGTVSDDDGVVELLVDGAPASIAVDDSFVATVPLALGDNVVTLEARDTNDEWVSRTRRFHYSLADGDGDGLSDCRERALAVAHACLSVSDGDSDGDGLADGDEIARGADPCATDSDGDGCGDRIDPTPGVADTAECLALLGGFRADVHDEPPGAHCAEGGRRVTFGRDVDGDGALSPGEVERTIYVCDERARTLLGISTIAPGGVCPAGGYRLEVAADLDGDLTIDRPDELLSSFEVCDGVDGTNGLTSLVATRPLPAGATCAAGGIELRYGLDDDRDGVLDDGEVDQVRALCHGRDGDDGEDGQDGEDGREALVVVTVEPPGAACVAGGQRIQVGLDDDRDGVLDAGEIDATSRVCNGLVGEDGAPGADGQDGTAALVAVSPEPGGARCAEGGQRLDVGLDLDRDEVLDPEEIVSSAWVCHGARAQDGHTTLIAMSDLAPGEECAAGGLRLVSGIDDDRDGALAAGEVDDTRVLCRAEDGLTALVSITEEPAGERCPTGGQRVQVGLDDDRDGTLDADEVDQTSYVCNGAAGGSGEAGEDGSDGASALVVLEDVAPGDACPGGGVAIRSGLDADRDGVLGADETTETRVVCDGAAATSKDEGCHGGGTNWAPLGLFVLGLGSWRRLPQRKSGV